MNGVFVTFMFWYLTDINPSQATWAIGVAGAGRNIVAAIGFGYSGHVIRKLGVINTIILSLGVLRAGFCDLWTNVKNPWLAIIPELMQKHLLRLFHSSVHFVFQRKITRRIFSNNTRYCVLMFTLV
ncbi:hypothetical protein OS493_024912 [Desmophyllum pertusum]|uniref:Major facilitator superfamily associated domain-containing protein n=1 Tax=Desmophyllum pertusum TaxID=174260 RepID=A0A9W9YLG2_9CNID|nr:hypothetical protein OS493_024912 [Desmophyllum pertusum]